MGPKTRVPAGESEASPAEDGEGDGAMGLFELVMTEAPNQPPPSRIDGVVVGRVVALAERGAPLVEFAENGAAAPLEARSIAPVGVADVGREVALLFEGGNPSRPILMGWMYEPAAITGESSTPAESPAARSESKATPEVERDGERLVLTAQREIVLKCGQASITLTRAGKIIIRGAYLLARSSGVNRIQGGSVQIN
jgi:hypothetical protein